MRGLYPRIEPLTRPAGTLSHKGRGKKISRGGLASDLLRGFQPRAKRPAPQTGMEKPGTTNGAKPDGSIDTTGMSATKGNIKRGKDGAPAPKDEKK